MGMKAWWRVRRWERAVEKGLLLLVVTDRLRVVCRTVVFGVWYALVGIGVW